jgi:hypothetical protein
VTNPYMMGDPSAGSTLSPAHAAGAIVIAAVVGLVVLNRLAVSLRVG